MILNVVGEPRPGSRLYGVRTARLLEEETFRFAWWVREPDDSDFVGNPYGGHWDGDEHRVTLVPKDNLDACPWIYYGQRIRTFGDTCEADEYLRRVLANKLRPATEWCWVYQATMFSIERG